MITILIIILVLMLIGALPSWPHSRNWGYRPVGGLGLPEIMLFVEEGEGVGFLGERHDAGGGEEVCHDAAMRAV